METLSYTTKAPAAAPPPKRERESVLCFGGLIEIPKVTGDSPTLEEAQRLTAAWIKEADGAGVIDNLMTGAKVLGETYTLPYNQNQVVNRLEIYSGPEGILAAHYWERSHLINRAANLVYHGEFKFCLVVANDEALEPDREFVYGANIAYLFEGDIQQGPGGPGIRNPYSANLLKKYRGQRFIFPGHWWDFVISRSLEIEQESAFSAAAAQKRQREESDIFTNIRILKNRFGGLSNGK